MIRAVFLIALLWASAALAQVAPPSTFMGINGNRDVTVTPYPNFAARDRLWNASYGAAISNATLWATLNPSAGVFNWTTLDPLLTAAAAARQRTNYTLGKVPAFVNSAQNVTGATQRGQMTAFVSALMSHVAANRQCFGYFEAWNESQVGTTWWTGTMADVAANAAATYPIVKAACPQTTVLSPSNGGDGGIYAYPWWQSLQPCVSGCFDALSLHAYDGALVTGTTDYTLSFQPELTLALTTQTQAIQANLGTKFPVWASEGYAGFSTAGQTGYTRADQAANAQGVKALLLAGAGVQGWDYFGWGTGCTQPCTDAYQAGGPNGLSPVGLALRSVTGWLAGATITTPFARTAGTNLIQTAPNGAGVATGLIGGSGGCAGAPSGTGALPSRWSVSGSPGFTAGMSAYVVGFDGLNGGEIQVRVCGTDTTSGSGVHTVNFQMDSGAAVSVGANYQMGLCWANPAGSMANIAQMIFSWNEANSSFAYNNGYSVVYTLFPLAAPVSQQCYSVRSKVQAAGTAYLQPLATVEYNYASGTLPVDITLTIAAPFLDAGGSNNGMLWTGNINKAGGYAGTIMWCADPVAFCNVTVPAGATSKRDLFGGYTPVVAGAADIVGGPVLYESTAQAVLLP